MNAKFMMILYYNDDSSIIMLQDFLKKEPASHK